MNYQANDRIRIALIGAGGMGNGDVRDALLNAGVEFVGAADIYDSRLDRIKEVYGAGVFTTRDYREMLNRSDVDAVIVATPDHLHARVSIDALNAGKDVYCEKPMVQTIDEGHQVIEASAKNPSRIFMVGSQYASALSFAKIRALLKSGRDRRVEPRGKLARPQHSVGRVAVFDSADASPRTSTGTASSRTRRSARSSRSGCSAGATIRTTARRSPAISSSISSPACTRPLRSRVQSASTPLAAALLEGRPRRAGHDVRHHRVSEVGHASRVHLRHARELQVVGAAGAVRLQVRRQRGHHHDRYPERDTVAQDA
jgi:hypothetical protein